MQHAQAQVPMFVWLESSYGKAHSRASIHTDAVSSYLSQASYKLRGSSKGPLRVSNPMSRDQSRALVWLSG